MRTIKFRAWHKKRKEMFDVVNIFWVDPIEKNLIFEGAYISNEKSGKIEVWPDEIELIEYTGLKDKNNIDIFESDIVKVSMIKMEVKFPEYWRWLVDLTQEVIGNKFENPELLKE